MSSSDAHGLDDLGRSWCKLAVQAASIEELALALAGWEGRGVAGLGRRER